MISVVVAVDDTLGYMASEMRIATGMSEFGVYINNSLHNLIIINSL